MEILLIKNMIWPALMTVAIISFLDYILDRKKMKRYIAIAFTMIGIIAMVYFMVNNSEYKFLQIFYNNLNSLIFEVEGTCTPRHKSVNSPCEYKVTLSSSGIASINSNL